MNVIYICNRGENGGATKALLSLINKIREQDKNFHPIVLTPVKNGKVKKFCESNEIDCYYIKYFEIAYSLNTSKLRKIIKVMLLPFFYICHEVINRIAAKKINKIIDFSTINYIHTNVGRDNFGILLAKKYKIKHIMHLREFGTLDYNCIYLKKNIYKYFDDNTNIFIAVSKAIKDFYITKGIEAKKIRVIYDGIENDKIIPKDYSNQDDDIMKILILSGINKNKGQIQVINAVGNIEEEIRKKIHIYLYGRCTNEYLKYLKKIINKYNLNNQVFFMGYQNDVYSKISQYDLAITPSKCEAFGLVTAEYMFARLPIIASDRGSNLEIIDDKFSGLIYKYNDIEDLKSKIIYMYENKEKRKYFGNNAYEKAVKEYTDKINCERIRKIYG